MRTLPIKVDPLPGEGIDSWLEAIAHRYDTKYGHILERVGLNPQQRQWLVSLDIDEAQDISVATGIAPKVIHAMTLRRYDGTALVINDASRTVHDHLSGKCSRSRYCPQCLTETHGRWQLQWRLVWSFLCLQHRCLLKDYCSLCGNTQRARRLMSSAVPQPARCIRRCHDNEDQQCEADLRAVDIVTLSADHPAHAAQATLLTVIEQGSAAFGVYASEPVSASSALRDGRFIASLLLSITDKELLRAELPENLYAIYAGVMDKPTPSESHYRADRRLGSGTRSQAVATAVSIAIDILGGSGTSEAAEKMRWLLDKQPNQQGQRLIRQHTDITDLLNTIRIKAYSPFLSPVAQLRFRSMLAMPRFPVSGPAALNVTARSVPTHYWKRLALMFSVPGVRLPTLQSFLSLATLIIGTRAYRRMATDGLAAIGVSDQRISSFAKQLQGTSYWDAIAEGIIRIRDYLDAHPAPIDYTRRRRLDYTDNLLADEVWDAACERAGISVGYRRRNNLARSWIYELLNGTPAQYGPFNDETWKSYTFTDAYDAFLLLLTPDLIADLRAEARAYLKGHGIEERLSWQPPMTLLDGLHLPGRDPALELNKLLATKPKYNDSLTNLSGSSGIPFDTVRFLLETAPPQTNSFRRSRYHPSVPADTVRSLSAEGRNARQIGEILGFSEQTIRRTAGLAGFDIRRKPQKVELDCDWLRHQVIDHKRCFGEIACDLGLHPHTVARHATACGITLLTLSGHGCGSRPRKPATIRALTQALPDDASLEAWLTDQITVQRKAYTTIAAEIGVNPKIVISLAREYAIREPTLDTTSRGPTRPWRYSVQFRQRALTLLNSLIETQPTISNTRAINAIAKQLGLTENTLRRWQCQDQIH